MENCLNSIVDQTYSNHEIVFVDNDLKDNILKKVKAFESNSNVQLY